MRKGHSARATSSGFGRLEGAQDNNLALALAKLGRHDDSIAYAESALAHDPVNPIYVDTVAFVHDLAGDEQRAAITYRQALAADATSYVSANNLAVILAQDGQRAEAAAVLEDAVDGGAGLRDRLAQPGPSRGRRSLRTCSRRRARWPSRGGSTASCVARTTSSSTLRSTGPGLTSPSRSRRTGRTAGRRRARRTAHPERDRASPPARGVGARLRRRGGQGGGAGHDPTRTLGAGDTSTLLASFYPPGAPCSPVLSSWPSRWSGLDTRRPSARS